MLEIPPPAEEFRNLTFVEVEAAMHFSAEMNPIVAEVFRLTKAYVAVMEEMIATYGGIPGDFRIIPRYPIEEAALAWFRHLEREADERAADDARPANVNDPERRS